MKQVTSAAQTIKSDKMIPIRNDFFMVYYMLLKTATQNITWNMLSLILSTQA